MKNFKHIAILAIAFMTFSCSTEDTNSPVEEANSVEQNVTKGPLRNSVNVFITWATGTTEAQKYDIRRQYPIITWGVCLNDPDSETWRLPYCYPNCRPSVADPADEDDVKGAVIGGTCAKN